MINDHLALLDQSSKNYKDLIYDPDGVENTPVLTTQDIQKGAIHNSLEYNSRWKDRLKLERNLLTASSFLLDAWGTLFGIPRNSEIDSEYVEFIKGKILPPNFTLSWIKENLPPDSAQEAQETGFFLDEDYMNDSVAQNDTGSVLTARSNAIYITLPTSEGANWDFIFFLERARVAGVALYYRGVNDPNYMFLSNSYLNDSFLGEI